MKKIRYKKHINGSVFGMQKFKTSPIEGKLFRSLMLFCNETEFKIFWIEFGYKNNTNTSTYSARVVIHNNTSKPLKANSVKSRTNP